MNSSSMVLVVLVVLSISISVSTSVYVSISLSNPQVLHARAVNQQVYVTVAIDTAAESNIKAGRQLWPSNEEMGKLSTESRICLHLDGRACSCVQMNKTNPLSEAMLLATPGCMYEERGFWTSVSISCSHFLHSSSAPLYIVPMNTSMLQGNNSSGDGDGDGADTKDEKISLVLPLCSKDTHRANALITSLRQLEQSLVLMFYIIVPDTQLETIENQLASELSMLTFQSKFVKQSSLFEKSAVLLENNVDGYVLQMAIKLFIANIIETQFYITLDADVVLLRRFEYRDLIISNINSESGLLTKRGIYENEGREVHLNWWVHSCKLLKSSSFGCKEANGSDGFGVTPAVLSAWGSATVLDRLKSIYGENRIEEKLLEKFNENIWTEYTLYALILYDYGVFDMLHIEHDVEDRKIIHCNDVWYHHQLPWNAQAAYENKKCLFSVIQSTSGVTPVEIIQQMQENGGGPMIHSDSITSIEKSPDLDILKERYIHHTEEF